MFRMTHNKYAKFQSSTSTIPLMIRNKDKTSYCQFYFLYDCQFHSLYGCHLDYRSAVKFVNGCTKKLVTSVIINFTFSVPLLFMRELAAKDNFQPPLFNQIYELDLKTYLSFEILQSMTVFLQVLTMIKGRCIVVLGRGAPFSSSNFLFRFTTFLNAIC